MSKNVIDLNCSSALSPETLKELAQYQHLFCQHEYLEDILSAAPVDSIKRKIEQKLKDSRVIVFHCTKQMKGLDFSRIGLRLTNLRDHQHEFLNKFGPQLGPVLINQFLAEWSKYFCINQRAGREGMIWFCVSKHLIGSEGTNTFFRYFGGEALFMPVQNIPHLASVLENIGEPVVVVAAIPFAEIYSFSDLSLVPLSVYHCSVNRNARPLEVEGHVKRPVLPTEILSVVPLEKFLSGGLQGGHVDIL